MHSARPYLHSIAAIFLVAAACSAVPSAGTVIPPKKIALLLPDTSSARYETRDRPLFEGRLASVCPSCQVTYSNANRDSAMQRHQAEAALSSGAGVLVLDPVDNAAAAAIASQASARHVPVIAYDRFIVGVPEIAYYVSFDNEAIGSLQATALLQALHDKNGAGVVMINGDPADGQATLFKKGAHNVLDGKVDVVMEFSTPAGSTDGAQAEMSQALAATQNKVDGVYAASDALATGAIAALKHADVKPLPPVTGGDAELEAIQRILLGEQYMTVYKAIRQEAEAAAQLAYDLAYGITVPDAMTGGRTVDTGAGSIPVVLIAPVAVTRATLVATVIADGFWTRTDICTPQYVPACQKAGIT